MGTYILLLFFHSGLLGYFANSSTNIPGFIDEQQCIDAGEKSKKLVKGTVKEVNYICLYQPR